MANSSDEEQEGPREGDEKEEVASSGGEPAQRGASGRYYFTQEDVKTHNCAEDCWVIVFGVVLDLTGLLSENMGPLAMPIIASAGTDISHWFTQKTGLVNIRTYVDEETGIVVPYLPQGRFLHVAPTFPTTQWRTNFGLPWWRDPQYVIGKLSTRTRKICVVNMLTQQEDELRVASEEPIASIQERYNEYNSHAASYTWKALKHGGEVFEELAMNETLEENGVQDDSEELESLGMGDDSLKPRVHIYYNDDLTAA